MALASVLLGGCADAPEPAVLASRMDPIRGGQIDQTSTNVMGITISLGFGGGLCTGTLIAPNLVLTAQHCVAPTPDGPVICGRATFGDTYAPNTFTATPQTQISFNGRGAYGVREVRVARPNGDICGGDIALLVLDENVPANVAVPLVPRLDDAIRAGERFTAVGYGEVGDGSGSGVRRVINNREIVCAGNCGRFGGVAATEWIGNDGTCQGDSGGPAIDAEGRVFGALSRGGDGCVYPVYSSTVGWAQWLRDMGDYAATLGGYEPLPWVSGANAGPPPPDSDGDGLRDPYDNCPDDANADQADLDRDGVGDLCDDFDDNDRGGNCAICNGCTTDEDCGPGNGCADTGSGGICTRVCEESADCPDSTACFQVQRGLAVCLNANAQQVGVCAESFVCGGARPMEPEEPEEPEEPVEPDAGPAPDADLAPDGGVPDGVDGGITGSVDDDDGGDPGLDDPELPARVGGQSSGCSAGDQSSAPWWLLSLMLLAPRRRRR